MVAATTKKYYNFNPASYQRFGASRGTRKHRGTDFAHGNGTLVPALITGRVVTKNVPASWHGFGYQIVTEGSFGGRKYRVSYAHGSKAQPAKIGVLIDQGDFLSTEGRTGATDGPCCHVEVYDITAKKFIDPMILVKKVLTAGSVAGNPRPATVRPGMKGSTVKRMQVRLRAKGYKITADGIYGRKTLAAVKAFQKKNKLVIDGIVGPKTWAKLGY